MTTKVKVVLSTSCHYLCLLIGESHLVSGRVFSKSGNLIGGDGEFCSGIYFLILGVP